MLNDKNVSVDTLNKFAHNGTFTIFVWIMEILNKYMYKLMDILLQSMNKYILVSNYILLSTNLRKLFNWVRQYISNYV